MATPLTKNYAELVEVGKKVERGELTLLGDRWRTKQTKSRVWSVFARILDKNGEQLPTIVFCTKCRNAFNYMRKTTTSLIRHKCYQNFIKNDAEVSKDETEKPNLKIEEENPKITEIGNAYSPFITDSLASLITKWMIKECQPYELLQSESLKAVFHKLAVLGSKLGDDINVENFLPNLTEARKSLSEIYEQCFERVREEIALIKEHGLGLTSDIWTDNFRKQSYIVLTAHYVHNCVLKQRLLGLRACETGGINTKQIILNKTKQILKDFDCNLSEKSPIVSDPAYSMPDTSLDVQNLPCLSQLLSNAITKSVDEVPEVWEIIDACSNLVDCVIKMDQETLLDEFLNNSYSNRFLKTYNMLNCIEENWGNIEEVLQNLNEKAKILAISVYRLRAVLKALQPFEEAIKAFEDDSSPTLHLAIVYLHELKKSCDTSESEFQDFNFIQNLKEKLCFHIQKIMMEDIKTLHKIALFLYPPTNKLLQFSDTEKRVIEEECMRLMKNYKQENDHTLKPKLEPGTSPSSAKKTKNLFSDFIVSKPNQDSCDLLSQQIQHNNKSYPTKKRKNLFSDFIVSETNQNSSDLFSREIQFYKSFDAVYSEGFDVFNWWQLRQDNFPYLYKLSCAVLATPATCAASKRFLSNGASLLANKSIQITKEMELRKILFLNCKAEKDELE